MKIGYCRVSLENQCLDRQSDAIMNYGVDKLFEEKFTGTISSRPEFDKLKIMARAGDIVVVESLSRLGRSSKDLLNLLDDFESREIKVVSLKESIDTTTPVGKMLITVLSALSQFERDVTVLRTCEGLKSARARGRVGGRPPVPAKDVEKAIKLYDSQTYSLKEIEQITKISTATLYRALGKRKQLNENVS